MSSPPQKKLVCWLSLGKVIPSHGQKGVLLGNSLRIPTVQVILGDGRGLFFPNFVLENHRPAIMENIKVKEGVFKKSF